MSSETAVVSTKPRTIVRWLLSAVMIFAGLGHIFWARKEFQAQVPDALDPIIDKDAVVVASGAVEAMFGAALLVLPKSRKRVGGLLAAFFVAVFPGNVDQWLKKRDGFGLDTDAKRFARLPFQVLLVVLSLWSTRAPRR